ncbi:hypothetical protein BO71DRAFT_396798 [Aspergillus ellipticus CBS 707.79]|uniref:Uncharacterized protein n=1 Tax=Aspergillus ellipticus CBS 707.79 TaxID=1448320 RepID=A0A319EY01_9EURO|nr:hypothetical protein BO71DRAFT_396798 [Aspergillus ellipticus CBS 707.79]
MSSSPSQQTIFNEIMHGLHALNEYKEFVYEDVTQSVEGLSTAARNRKWLGRVMASHPGRQGSMDVWYE